MDHRSEDVEIVRSVGNPSIDEENLEKNVSPANDGDDGGGVAPVDDAGPLVSENGEDEGALPQCKIKRNYSCSLCPFFSQNPRSFLYHSRDVHFDKIKIYECSQCLYASKHSQKLQRHISMIHVPGKTRKTRNRMVKTDRKEPRPIRPKPPDLSPERPVKGLSLLNDEQKSKSEGENNGEPQKTTDGEFKCTSCSFKHRNPKFLRRHEKVVHLKKRFLKCSKCSYVTHVTARFTKHVKYHSMPMIKCDLCDFRTPYKWNLDRHYKNHSGSGAFQCAKCNFRADIKQSLTVHEMNHHVPPVGQGAVMTRRRNKVGASEILKSECEKIDQDDLEMLILEDEDSEFGPSQEADTVEKQTERVPNLQNLRNVKLPHNSKRESASSNSFQADFIHPDDIVPRYGQIYVKNLKCKFCSYKAVFSHEIWRHEKRIHGYVREESKNENATKRPPPRLIPIQNKNNASAILKIPSVKNKNGVPSPEAPSIEKPVNETEFNEMCKKSSLTSSLKDFVSLIGDEEGLKTIPDSSREDLEVECSELKTESTENSENKTENSSKRKQTDLLKKKNASFFDKLKEKLLTGNNEEQSLFCEVCGHESKCLSESVAHQKRHLTTNCKTDTESHAENDIVLSGTGLSSTRCQHCRQRCKTSTDLINHLKICKAFEASLDSQQNSSDVPEKEKTEEISMECENEVKVTESETPMENRVFVWNDLSQTRKEEDEISGVEADALANEEPLITSPGFGTVTSKGSDNTESGTLVMEADPRLSVVVKKVFKCPHCSFWASTASRFHVHIVGHLNKKPFECSLCLYRSNWRWDITKHIRLKSLRDPNHGQAKVNMTDETGRRNYSKYNRFLTMMRVQEARAESSGYGRRSRSGDVTQGNATEKDIIPLPAPPRLTRAPTPGVSHQLPQGVPLRPPPPLKAAHHITTDPKPCKPLREHIKKTFWKCKKCNFRDTQKGRVLSHVKKHYMSKKSEMTSSFKATSSNSSADQVQSYSNSKHSLPKSPSYNCENLQKQQQHCKPKPNSGVFVEVKQNEEISQTATQNEEIQEEQRDDQAKIIFCDICPFTTDSEGDLTAHKLNHVDRPGSIFKCSYCPFYVPSKIAVLEHMEIHGVNDRAELTSLKVDSCDPNEEMLPTKTEKWNLAMKKYKCLQCPYVSHSRSQFLYHKQFHKPRTLPFKCLYCTYNVSRRHLLHQHLRVHHNHNHKKSETEDDELEETTLQEDQEKPAEKLAEKPTEKVTDKPAEKLAEKPMEKPTEKVIEEPAKEPTEKPAKKPTEKPQENPAEEPTEEPKEKPAEKPTEESTEKLPEKPEITGLDIPEIPLVWVFKFGSFQKMYKCRWCPHVNARKANIQDHEKMHQPKESKKQSPAKWMGLKCKECNYSCNNAGVLASHVKVHQGFFGEIRCLFDPARSEEEQIQELENNLKTTDPEFESENSEVEMERSESLSFQPENAYSRCESSDSTDVSKKILSFCDRCPARFFYKKELRIHSKFHTIHLPFRCCFCSYTARQRPHLLAHYKVHSQEYQEKTYRLKDLYPCTPEYPQPKSKIITRMSDVMEGPVWVVKSSKEVKPLRKFSCHRCPAKFFKLPALQYHLNLHGASQQYQCMYCDYSVKAYGNLVKHQSVHEKSKLKKNKKFSYSFTISGTDLGQSQENTKNQKDDIKIDGKETKPTTRTSPEFNNTSYVKNGMNQKKRYQCQKCPAAFEKRHQYEAHFSHHGSNQRFQCEQCDYSVKYNANFVQHVKKHENYEALKAKMSEKPNDETPQCGRKDEKPFELTLVERQTLLLQERKNSLELGEQEKTKVFFCGYCPYSSNRRDSMDSHTWRHSLVSGIKSWFDCSFCDFSSPQSNILREHRKLHFNGSARYKAEAFLKCEKMELWCCEEDAKDQKQFLIFQDKGHKELERFFPPMESNQGIDLTMEDMIEMEEEVEDPKLKKYRGKNWRCEKCPHAFGKRDQFLRHVSLHGSNQRHNCDICDYSVKFYTNYVQHMRMHQMYEPDRVITVKKNFQNLAESSQRFISESFIEEDSRLSLEETQNEESKGAVENLDDEENSQSNEKLLIFESKYKEDPSLKETSEE